MKSFTESQIQNIYWRKTSNHDWICPNFYPVGWFECDIFSLTKAGYFHEHEIKLSRQDFLNDVKKTLRIGYRKQDTKTKYELLEEGYDKGPVQFWYLVPEGLIEIADLPYFAGLKYVCKYNRIRTIQKAKRLHNHKIDESFYQRIGTTFYYRFWQERCKSR